MKQSARNDFFPFRAFAWTSSVSIARARARVSPHASQCCSPRAYGEKRSRNGVFFERCLDMVVPMFLLRWTRIYDSLTIPKGSTREGSQARCLCIKKRRPITVSTHARFVDFFDRRNFYANRRGNRKRKQKAAETGEAGLGPSWTSAETFFDLSLL